MLEIGGVVTFIAVVLAAFAFMQRAKGERMKQTPLVATGSIPRHGHAVAGVNGQLSAQGRLVCRKPVHAPLSGQPCLYYKLTARAEWKVGNLTMSQVIDEETRAAQFAIDDGSGPVVVEMPGGNDFDGLLTRRESKCPAELGAAGGDLMFGEYRLATRAYAPETRFVVEESLLGLQPRMFVCGELSAAGTIVRPATEPLLLSGSSHEQLVVNAKERTTLHFAAAAGALIIGVVLSGAGWGLSDDDLPRAARHLAVDTKPLINATLPVQVSVPARASAAPPLFVFPVAPAPDPVPSPPLKAPKKEKRSTRHPASAMR